MTVNKAMSYFCFAAAAVGIILNLSHHWYYTDLMVLAYVALAPLLILGFRWSCK